MILVTGLMRSGTTPLAKMLHQMGVCMGTYQRFPSVNPLSDFEWEDAGLADPLASALLKNDSRSPKDIIDAYVQQRVDSCGGRQFGTKTAFAMPFVNQFRAACEQRGEPFDVVLTDRDQSETVVSMASQLSHLPPNMLGIAMHNFELAQDALAGHWQIASESAEVFHIKDTHENHELVANRLSRVAMVEIENMENVTRGIWCERPCR